ncbi:MAG: hypothetical protein H0U03_02730 [Actinobacteria bacterium]|nr:hypothetical protein [Actinomycetota bacterium]
MNRNGTPASLVPAPAGNVRAARHGIYSERLREPRAQEHFDAILDLPWIGEADIIGARQVARLEALIEALSDEVFRVGVGSKKAEKLIDMELRAIRRQAELLSRFGLDPKSRADWTAKLTSGTLGERIAARIAEIEANE